MPRTSPPPPLENRVPPGADPCCGHSLSVGEAFPVEWIPWVLDEAARRDVAVSGVRWMEQDWVPCALSELAELAELAEPHASVASVVQRLGCRGVRTRLELGNARGVLGGVFCEAAHEPKAWRALLLEALVLADGHVEALAAK